jgi:hypothetical protein
MTSGRVHVARRTSRGQATAEFALVAGVLMILFLSVIEFGHMVAMHAATVTASREAARYGSTTGEDGSGTPHYVDCVGIREAARRVTGGIITLRDDQIRISYDDGSGTPKSEPCAPFGSGPSAGEIARFDRIAVQITLTYQAIALPVDTLVGPITVVSVHRRTIMKSP